MKQRIVVLQSSVASDCRHMWSGPGIFAYGGAGFIVSRPAMHRVATYYSLHQKEFEDFVDNHWAGDHALGKAV